MAGFDPTYNPFTLKGKAILITGASSGIGQATAIECSKLGASCIVTGRNTERLLETFSMLVGDNHRQVVADISTQEGIDSLVADVECIDGLVNNAGVNKKKTLSFYKQEDLDFVYHTNVYAPMLLTKALVKKKKINKGGSIVFTSSVAAFSSDLANGIYGSSKSALMAYMHYCARELAEKNIRANAVLPGMVETKLIHSGLVSDDELQKDVLRYPLKRYGKVAEIARAIVFLLSDASSWTTGTSLVVDGGISLT